MEKTVIDQVFPIDFKYNAGDKKIIDSEKILVLNKCILFVTTANLSTNPRLLKEVLFFKEKNIQCEILAFKLGNWYDDNDQRIIEDNQLNVQFISASRKPFLPWLVSSIIQICAQRSWTKNSGLKHTAFASNKRSFLLNKRLNKKSKGYDLVIAHNLGALFPTYKFSIRKQLPFAFDVEDYHPGETIELDAENEKRRRHCLLQTILPHCEYISFASPLIEEEIRKSIHLPDKKCVVVNNSFFEHEFQAPVKIDDEKVYFVWFSQNISFGRGLEQFLSAADAFSSKIVVVLIGTMDEEFRRKVIAQRSYVVVKAPMGQEELHHYLANFDIGLALELSTSDLNRDICLTNKLFAYVQAGLFVLATDTLAQVKFLDENPGFGKITPQDITSMRTAIEQIVENSKMIRKQRKERFCQAKKMSFNYEVEELHKKVMKITKA